MCELSRWAEEKIEEIVGAYPEISWLKSLPPDKQEHICYALAYYGNKQVAEFAEMKNAEIERIKKEKLKKSLDKLAENIATRLAELLPKK
jgi:hypothetical protein